jgi:hypothetical protein
VKGLKYNLVAWLVISAALVTLNSCEQKKEQNVLSHQEMVRVMSEIYLVEDKVNRLSLDPDSSRKVFEVMKEKALQKTEISDSVLQRSLNYYMEHPIEMEKIYTTLVDSLNLKEQRTLPAFP